MIAALIENDVVINTIVIDSLDDLPDMRLVEIPDGLGVGIDWLYRDNVFVNPEALEPIPEPIPEETETEINMEPDTNELVSVGSES